MTVDLPSRDHYSSRSKGNECSGWHRRLDHLKKRVPFEHRLQLVQSKTPIPVLLCREEFRSDARWELRTLTRRTFSATDLLLSARPWKYLAVFSLFPASSSIAFALSLFSLTRSSTCLRSLSDSYFSWPDMRSRFMSFIDLRHTSQSFAPVLHY